MIALVALEAGCLQRPNATQLLGLNASVFSAWQISVVDPSTLQASKSTTLSTPALAGIAAGSAALALILAAAVFIRCRKRRNRANKAGISPRWVKDRRRSSFSFKCRNILASPLSPKFFSDLPPVHEQRQPYGSLEEQMATMSHVNRAPDGRYYIESKPRIESFPYESSLDGRRTRDTSSSLQSTLVSDQHYEQELHVPKKRGPLHRTLMALDTSEAGLSPPPATHHHSPRANEAGYSPSAPRYAPALSATPGPYPGGINRTPTTSPAPSFNNTHHRGSPKPPKTTMSSQGSGYPSNNNSRKSPSGTSPQPSQHGWPSARSAQEPWFPPPPGAAGLAPGAAKSARKVSLGAVGAAAKKGRRESGSPVESKQIRMAFAAPPGR